MSNKVIWQRGDSVDKYPSQVPEAAKNISKVVEENGTLAFYVDFTDDELTGKGKTIKRMC